MSHPIYEPGPIPVDPGPGDVVSDDQVEETREEVRNNIYDSTSAALRENDEYIELRLTNAEQAATGASMTMDLQAQAERAAGAFDAQLPPSVQADPQMQASYRKSAVAAIACGLTVALGATLVGLYFGGLLTTAQNPSPAPPPDPNPTPEEDWEKNLRDMVDRWRNLTEDQFWQAMKTWVQMENPSWTKQLYVSNYALQFATPPTPPMSPNAGIAQVVADWNSDHDAPAIYEYLRTATVDNAPVSRYTKLQVLSGAIEQIIQSEKGGGG